MYILNLNDLNPTFVGYCFVNFDNQRQKGIKLGKKKVLKQLENN